MQTRYLLAAVVLFFTQHANAGLYVEPLVGYTQANTEYTAKTAYGGASEKSAITGLVYGGELGWNFGMLRIGANVEMGNQEVKAESTGTTTKWATSAALLMVGYKFPKDIIGYVGIGTGSSVDDQTPKTTVTGTVLKAGGSHEFVNHVAVSVEWIVYNWDESTTEGSSAIKFADYYEKYSSNGVQASLRFPFEIGGK